MLILLLPFFLILLLFAIVILAWFRKWRWVLVLTILGILLNWWCEFIPFHLLHSSKASQGHSLKVMCFNINRGGEDFNKRLYGIDSLVIAEDADVVFLTEFLNQGKADELLLDSLLSKHYKYSELEKQMYFGNVFYSKYPIKLNEMVGINLGKSLPYISVNHKGKELKFLGCHLSSNNYVVGNTRLDIDSVESRTTALEYLKTIERGYNNRHNDADSIYVRLNTEDNSHLVVLGDMNDIGGSYCIRKIESRLKRCLVERRLWTWRDTQGARLSFSNRPYTVWQGVPIA